MFSASQSKYCSCVIAAHRMIYSFNLPVYLYQLVVTYVICWLPVNKQYHDEVCISNQLKLLDFFQNWAIHLCCECFGISWLCWYLNVLIEINAAVVRLVLFFERLYYNFK
jgi:hypothetical protein